MKTWNERPKEEAYLLNPAFCSITLAAAIWGYTSVKKEGLPFPLAFMFLPIVLHKSTRESLPPSIRTSLAAWLQENPNARILFYERLMSLKPYTKEALHFGILKERIVHRNGGLLETTLSNSDITRIIQRLADEVRECVLRSRFVGKWLASAGTTHTVMTFWGVRP